MKRTKDWVNEKKKDRRREWGKSWEEEIGKKRREENKKKERKKKRKKKRKKRTERPDVLMKTASCAQLQEGIRYSGSRAQSRRVAPDQCFFVNASYSFPSPAQNRQHQTQLNTSFCHQTS